MTFLHTVLGLVFLLAAAFFAVLIVAFFTVIPMRANYKECGTIFLCSAQHAAHQSRQGE